MRRPLLDLGRASSVLSSALVLAASISGLSGSSSFTSSFTTSLSFGTHFFLGDADLDACLDGLRPEDGAGEALELLALAEALLLLFLLVVGGRDGADFEEQVSWRSQALPFSILSQELSGTGGSQVSSLPHAQAPLPLEEFRLPLLEFLLFLDGGRASPLSLDGGRASPCACMAPIKFALGA